jgi:endonuclease-3
MAAREAFDIDKAIQLLQKAVEKLPKAALFDLYDQGYTSLFEQLIACMISIRTYDEVTVPTAIRLFEQARTAADMARLSVEEIDSAIRDCTFHEGKARQVLAISHTIVEDYR